MSLKIDIKKSLPSFELNINFEHSKGILGILGASGFGKSMTLKSIAGLITPDTGSIILDDEILFDSSKKINLKPQKRSAGYLFQNYALFPNMTVYENIEAGLFKLPKDEKKKITEYYIEKLNLRGLENHYPSELSGGQQQRTALARAIAPKPKILLLDEPFSALDVHLKSKLEKDLIPILKEYEGLVIMVSHDISESYRICDEIIVYDEGSALPKRNKEDLFNNPTNLIEAQITGCQNIFKCRRMDEHNVYIDDLSMTINCNYKIDTNINFTGIRSHDIKIVNDSYHNNSLRVQIYDIVKNPFSLKIYAKTEENHIIEIETDRKDFKINDYIYIHFLEEDMFFF